MPSYERAEKYLAKGAGAILTFGIKGEPMPADVLSIILQLFSHVANVGDAKSLAIHPASTTHSQLNERGDAGCRGQSGSCSPERRA